MVERGLLEELTVLAWAGRAAKRHTVDIAALDKILFIVLTLLREFVLQLKKREYWQQVL